MEARTTPRVEVELEIMHVDKGESWMDPIISYIRDGKLLEDNIQLQYKGCIVPFFLSFCATIIRADTKVVSMARMCLFIY